MKRTERTATTPSTHRSNNVFCQLQHRSCEGSSLAHFRGVLNRFQLPLSQIVPAEDVQSVFLCHSRDGLHLVSYTVSGASYRLQVWEAPLWSRDSQCSELHKLAEIPLFASLTDSDVDQDELGEEKHLQISLVQTKCNCFVVTGHYPSTVENSQRVFVTVISPLAGCMTVLHFTYICFGPVLQPIVVPSKLCVADGGFYSFLLIFNTGDAFRAVRMSAAAWKEEDIGVLGKDASRFFREDNWLCDVTLKQIETKNLSGVEALKYEVLRSLELEPVLARWLSQNAGEEHCLHDYSAVRVRSPEVAGNVLVAVVVVSTTSTANEKAFSVLALTLGFDSQHLGVVKLPWNRASLQKIALHNLKRSQLNPHSPSSPCHNSATPSLNDLCVAAASLLSRQRYLPSAKSDYTFATNNTPVFGCSRPMLLNPCFPVAIVL